MHDDSMMIRADARAIGAVTSTSTRVSPRWQQSARSVRSASECISYYNPDRSDARIFRIAPVTDSVPAPRSNVRDYSRSTPHRVTCVDLAPIGNVE